MTDLLQLSSTSLRQVVDKLATSLCKEEALSEQPCYKIVNNCKLLQVCWNQLSQAVRTQPVDKLLEHHCYKSSTSLLQVVRFLRMQVVYF